MKWVKSTLSKYHQPAVHSLFIDVGPTTFHFTFSDTKNQSFLCKYGG